ncbi:MAG: PDZ domain-containing protein [Myxococcales bacterium]|nr:PDZ domain-containing protein [Myxococcales bacterium]
MPANPRRSAQAPLLGLLLAIAAAGCWRVDSGSTAKTEAAAESAGEAPAAPLSDAFAAALSSGIRVNADDPSTVEVDSFVATVVVEALLSGTTGLEIRPRVDGDGATQGFRVANVAPGGPFARLGLRDGDVVAAINGVGLTSPGRALAVLRTARRQVVVAVERDDTALLLDLRLVDGLAWSATLADHGDGEDVAPAQPAAAPAIVEASALVAVVDDDALAEVASDAPTPGQPSAPTANGGSGGSSGGGAGKPIGKTGGGASKPSGKPSGKSGGSSSGGSSSGGSSTASCSSADDCTVRRSELDKILGNPSLASKQVRYTPHIQGGKHRGYRLTSVTPGSSVAGLGFKKGDVITAVNGHSLTDEGELFALYMGLSGTKTHKIRYQRGGATRVKTVRVQ